MTVIVTDNGETHITVETALHTRPITGFDTTILPMPTEFYVNVEVRGDGQAALAVQPFTEFLRRVGDKLASDIGERLHHAEFTITKERTTVEALGSMHDCDECRAGVRKGIRWLAENPGIELIVGQLYWAGP